jgi:flagellar biosynthetic protein FliR
MIDVATAAGLALLLVRPGMIVMATPFLGALNAPPQVRVGLTVLLALLLASAVRVPVALPASGLTVVVAREIAVGLSLAFSVRVIVFAAEFAGHLTGYQVGLSLGSLIDPQSGVSNNILALLYGNLAAVICLATNAHHALLRALAESYTWVPIGLGSLGPTVTESVARMLGLTFVLGTRIAAPMIVVMLLVELALGLVARVAPSLNVMIAGAPVRVVVGLLVVAVGLVALPPLIGEAVPLTLSLGANLAQAFR